MSPIKFAPLLGYRLSKYLLAPLMTRSMLHWLRPFEARTLEGITKALKVEAKTAWQIYKRGAENFSATSLDTFFMARHKPQVFQKKLDMVKVQGEEKLDPVLAKGSPILIITMHMGNFPYGFLKLMTTLKNKRKVFAFKYNPQNPNEDSMFEAFRHQKMEIEALRVGEEGGKRAFMELRKRNVVAMMVDSEIHVTSRADVTFFGQTCPMQSGPATLSVLTRAVMVPIINYIDSNGHPVVQVEQPLYPDKASPEETNQQVVTRLTQEIAKLMESWIQIDPSQLQAWTGVAETIQHCGTVHLPSIRPVTQKDVSWLIGRYRNRFESSYVALSSIHGNSESELRETLSNNTSVQYIDPTEGNELLLSLHDTGAVQGQARIQFCAEKSSESSGVVGYLKYLVEAEGVRRLYSYVFPHEEDEIRILTELGFEQEAVFREHVYIAGDYKDIAIYGLLGAAQ